MCQAFVAETELVFSTEGDLPATEQCLKSSKRALHEMELQL